MFPTSFDKQDPHPYGGLNPYSDKNKDVAKALTNLLTQFGNLKTTKQVLDLGCGTGRLLFELKNHITPQQYVGVDCNKTYLDLLQSTHGQQFKVVHVDAENPAFNPTGTVTPDDLKLPLQDNSISLIACFAFFNHVSGEWVSAYLEEINRLLTRDGRALTTWFLLSHFYAREKHNLESTYQFDHIKQTEHHVDAKRSNRNVAYSEAEIRKKVTSHNLRIVEPIRYGQWVNGPSAVTGHDFVILQKRL